jgi:branched-chain amino acid transport system substrate-binding protein
MQQLLRTLERLLEEAAEQERAVGAGQRSSSSQDRGRAIAAVPLLARAPRRAWPAAIVLVALAGLGVAVAAGGDGDGDGGGVAGGEPPVRIGALYSLTGTNAAAGRESLAGVRFAVDYVNSDRYPDLGLPMRPGAGLPRLGGAKLALDVEDVGGNRCSTQPAFDRLADKHHVAAVVGAYESTITLQAIHAANRHKLPLVNDTATAVSLTGDDGEKRPPANPCAAVNTDPTPSDWFSRVGPNDGQFAVLFGELIAAERKQGRRIRTAAILYESGDLYGNGAQLVTANLAHKLGIVLHKYRYGSQLSGEAAAPRSRCPDRKLVAQMHKQVKRIKALKPDVVFAVSYLNDAIIALQTMEKVAYNPPALLAYGAGYADTNFLARVRKGSPGCDLPPADPRGIITRAAGWTQIRGRQASRAADLFKRRYGIPMTDKAARSFTATIALAQAIDDAGSTDARRVQLAMRSLDVTSKQTILAGNGIKFDSNGQNRAARGVLLQVLGGKYVVVYPKKFATTTPVWPLAEAPG